MNPIAAFHNLKIRDKFLLTYAALILLPLIAVTWLAVQKTSHIVEERVVQSTGKSFEQANTFLSYKLKNVKDVSSILFMSRTLIDILQKQTESYSLSEQLDDYQRLLDILQSGQNSREIYSIRLYMKGTSIITKDNSSILRMDSIINTSWYKEMLSNEAGIYCRPTYSNDYLDSRGKQDIVSCVRPLFANGFTGDILGVLSIDVSERNIREIIEQANITREGNVFLLSPEGNVISSSDPAFLGKPLPQFAHIKDSLKIDRGMKAIKAGTDSSLLIYKPVEGTNWLLLAVIPQSEMWEQSRGLVSELLLLLGVVFVFVALTAVWMANGITRRIRLLQHQIGNIEAEKWESKISVDSKDEVGVLTNHINRMGDNIRALIQEKYQAEAIRKGAELRALQAQINPHFLYNTLDLIHWLALKHNAPQISQVVGRLAKFFRLSLSKGKDHITIGEELEHVRTYLDIQNMRFQQQFRYTIEADEDVLKYFTVKLILQPLAENSILHGLQEREDKQGEIRIAVCREGETVMVVLEDDGVGMSPEQTAVLNGEAEGCEAGYGIRNVAEKIRLYYGEAYGLRFEREPGRWTRAIIRIPVRNNEGSGM